MVLGLKRHFEKSTDSVGGPTVAPIPDDPAGDAAIAACIPNTGGDNLGLFKGKANGSFKIPEFQGMGGRVFLFRIIHESKTEVLGVATDC